MRFKKTIRIISFMIVIISLFACKAAEPIGQNGNETEQPSIKIGAVKKYGNNNPVLENYVLLYNKKHPERVATITYYDNEDQLKIALSTAERPDVVELSDIELRGADEFFVDLYPLLDGDEEYQRADLLESVLHAFEKNEKLLTLPSSFVIRTVTGRVRQIGSNTGWSLDELVAVKQALGNEYTYFSPRYGVEDMMSLASAFIQRQYVDWESYECDFESEDFLRWLELCKTCVTDNNNLSLQDWDEHILLYIEEIQSFERLEQIKSNYAGDPFIFKGFPSGANNNGSIISKFGMSLNLAIPMQNNSEASWIFIRDALSDQWQSGVMGLPIKKGIMEAYLNAMVEKRESILNEKDIEDFYELINDTLCYVSADDVISHIIIEETVGFFEGDKSATEVAKIINNRASIFLQERKKNS